KLQGSLEVAYGQFNEAENSEVFEEFFEWKNARLEKFSRVRNATDASLQNLVLSFSKIIQFFDLGSAILMKSEDVDFNVDEVLKNAEHDISQEFDMFLTELDEKDKKIILNMYSLVMWKILQEQDLINTLNQKYLESCEFKNQIVEWLDITPNTDDLLLIKKRMKNMKAKLRLKLGERNNLEETDNYSKSEMVEIKKEISVLQDNIFQDIYKEQEEYEKLIHLVQNIFPELPFLHPEIGILKYMNSGGLIVSLEFDLLNAEPMKELSIKRPVMCSTVQGQKILLKGYIMDMNIETKIMERAAKYHKVWKELREKSCLMQPMFLFLCKLHPIVYLMIPYYAGANLGALQMTAPLNVQETLKVMKGVACGLSVLHKADIIHGLLHKNNVFALNREEGIVGDFDFTKSESERALSDSMTLNGLSLISPELRKGQPPSPASDMYAFGCLLYWLLIGKEEIKTNIDGTPQVDALAMDDKVKALLSQLLCYENRMTAEQVSNADFFLSPDLISVPLESEGTEYVNGEQSSENEVSDERLNNKSEPSPEKDSDGFPKWDLAKALDFLTEPPFEPLKSSSLQHLTLKVVLVAIASLPKHGDKMLSLPAVAVLGVHSMIVRSGNMLCRQQAHNHRGYSQAHGSWRAMNKRYCSLAIPLVASSGSISEEEDLAEPDLYEDEGLVPDKPAFAGLFKSIMHKAKVITHQEVSPLADQGITDPSDPSAGLFDENIQTQDLVPDPKFFKDVVQHQWVQPDTWDTPGGNDKWLYAIEPSLGDLLKLPVIDVPVLTSTSVLPPELLEGLKVEDKRAETACHKTHQTVAWAIRASTLASFFSRASIAWLHQLLTLLPPGDAMLHQDVNKIMAAAKYTTDASLNAAKFTSRA
ncbi:PREDICTED: serine/threonine-protein kinase 31, partial [Thamnophis sirtalis]|uniref:Serine/threonine-protein kinase 31 n=1 Tax=Thamnophis sirtalis TaxID=35019 RepID=A0A6I9YW86_9SAUR